MAFWFGNLQVPNQTTQRNFLSKKNPLFDFDNKTDSIVVFFSCKINTSSNSALLGHHAQTQSSASKNFTSPLWKSTSSSNILCFWKKFTDHSYPKFNHLIGDQELVSLLSAMITPKLTNHPIEQKSTPPTPVSFHIRLLLDDQTFTQPRQDMRSHILLVNIGNKVYNVLIILAIENWIE